MVTRITAIICLLSCFCGTAFSQEKWGLRKAVDYAIVNNISVKQADLQARYSALNLKQEKASQFPNVTAGFNTSYNFGRNENPTTGVLEDNNYLSAGFNLQTSVTLFNWFSRRNSIAATELSVQAENAQVRKVQDDIALNVAAAYLQILLAVEQANITRIQVQQSRSQLDNTRKQVDAGNLPELNAAQLEAQLATDSSNLITAEANIQLAILQLKALLNLDAGAPFEVETPPVDQIPLESLADLQPETVFALAIVNLSSQRVNDLRLQSAIKGVAAARGAMYPSVSAFGGLNTGYAGIGFPVTTFTGQYESTGFLVNVNGTNYNVLSPVIVPTGAKTRVPFGTQVNQNFGQYIGLNLSIPIANGRSARTNWERSKLDVTNYEILKELDRQTLKQDIYRAYTDASAAIEKFNASRKGVETAERALNFSQKRYDLGLLSIYDLINSQNTVLRAKTELLLAQYDFVFKMKLLEFYKGQGLKL